MIGRINHIAIAVPNLLSAACKYHKALGAKVSEPQTLAEHGVRTIFVDVGHAKVELLEPLGPNSPIAGFLERNPDGGMHHICFEVADLAASVRMLTDQGARVLGEPKIGAHGLPVVFLHPKDFDGTLIELEEVKPTYLQPES